MRRITTAGLSLIVGLAAGACSTSPSVATTPSATATAAAGLPFADEMSGGTASSHGRAGTYQTRQLSPKLTFTVPADWGIGQIVRTFVGADESPGGIPLSDGAGLIVVTAPSSIYPPAPGDEGKAVPADLIAALAADKNMRLGAAAGVTIAGLTGSQVDGTVSGTVSLGADSGYRITDYLLVKPGYHVRFAVVTIGGRQVVVMTTAAASNWTAFAKVADGIIASMNFPS